MKNAEVAQARHFRIPQSENLAKKFWLLTLRRACLAMPAYNILSILKGSIETLGPESRAKPAERAGASG